MKVKTADLIGPTLDWAVAKCEGFSIEFESENGGRFWITRTNHAQQYLPPFGYLDQTFFPSSDWYQGGPILEREGIGISKHFADWSQQWHWCGKLGGLIHHGPTPLIAAMRCYCCAKLGEFIDIPEELCQQPNN